ncbi:NOGO-interacting [Hyphodiscus hymeniophilus]|uniref:NOGO-interacting n=1 Tax=Hyphodiscus hymeniophilus TaxID=353542 RepID=A0A9P6VN48_9HELO|nr:NOGO-interacting [Hyphodiscus hymeniophilus]
MAANIPQTMRAIALSKYCKPNEYAVATLPTPSISNPDELLIKVHAASVNPAGQNDGGKDSFPYKLGYDLAGTVVAVGTSVTNFSPGDEVYSRVPGHLRGSIAQYALSTSSTTALKPKTLSFGEAASMPLAAQTALQSLYRGEAETEGGLRGKTVFIPGALSGTGSFGVQLAKNVFGARVVSTVSSGKVGSVGTLLGKGTPDLVVDYTKDDVVKEIGKGSVDFMFDTVGQTFKSLPLMKKGASIVSISTLPSGKLIREMQPGVPLWLKVMLDVVNWVIELWTGWSGVRYSYLHLVGNTADLEKLAKWVDEGKVKPIVGESVGLEDIEGIRKGCMRIFEGKGGVGKFVIDIA